MQAIILAAGRGSRLKDLTKNKPKPFAFVKVNNCSIIERILQHLDELGVHDVVIVVGCLKEYFYENLGNKYGNVNITYVTSDDWENTNNSYSLYLARDYIKDNFLIIEGDEYFSKPFITKKDLSNKNNYWIGINQPVTGCLLFTDKKMNILDLDIVRNKEQLSKLSNYYKSCGVVKIKKNYIETFFDGLEQFLKLEENKKKYFDLYIKDNLNKLPLKLLPIDAYIVWGEVDDQDDLINLERELKKT